MSELDKYFPRNSEPPTIEAPQDGVRPWAAGLYEFGVTTPKAKKRRDPSKPTPAQLRRIGEGLTKYIFQKAGFPLRKIEEHEAWPGGPYKPVDLDYCNDAHRIKAEAKTWWTKHGTNNFPLSRISENQRRFFRNALNNVWRAYLTIALLDAEPTRKACDVVYIIPWAEWLKIEDELQTRTSGNYKGKSFRVRDLDLLEPFAVRRHGRRWETYSGHEEER